ncbi:hypothetical protein NDU88_001962 [Pleurodeles waltl]|uniref:Uncharacterized protein n=1 Tax=Pleurodeles waltl TaxID=8319 RepID=A0AAV7SB57_PLEWA|nr:hypothetical protein NDU88_001962 [Pleurodeles waltl]
MSQDSDDMRDDGHTPSPDGRCTVMKESQPQRSTTPRRMHTYAGAQHIEEGEGPSVFGGLESAMLKQQRLQNRKLSALQRQMQAHNPNMGGLHQQLECLNSNLTKLHDGQLQASENTRELTSAVRELCTELRHDRVSHRRQERRFMGMFRGFCCSVNGLATSTALISRRAVAAQVEAAHSSRDVAQGLMQITNVLDNMLGNRSATPSELGLGDTEDTSSLSRIAVPTTDARRRSAKHSTATEAENRGASRPLCTRVACVAIESDSNGHRGLFYHCVIQ